MDAEAKLASGSLEPEDPLTELVFRALQRFEEAGDAGLEAFCAEQGPHREAILARVSSLRRVGLVGDAGERTDDFPRAIGEFELLEQIGGGGMGVVFRARQSSIGRDVALKLVRPEHLFFPGTRARFEREIRVVARLRHENIVQLYSVGHDDGMPWFAMEHVVGADLAAVLLQVAGRKPSELNGEDFRAAVLAIAGIEELASDAPPPALFEGSWVRVCLRIAERVADALAHAHAHGVLHRDLKPSNVMVTPAGRVVLMDFGLASTIGDERITRSGAMLGSLQYMAPEQIAPGKDEARIDERTDVFALGVTLYELLALRSPFEGKNSSAILSRIKEAAPRPLASVHPSISRDVQIICETALAPEPERRYPSASALARDLKSFLDLRPIAARRASLALRAWRWSQRHPAVPVTAAIALAALLVTPAILYQRERAALQERTALSEARDREWRRAHENLSLATSAVNQILVRVAEDWVADDFESMRVRSVLLDDAAGFLDQLAAGNLEDPVLRINQAEALIRAAEVHRALRQLPRAQHYYDTARSILESLPNDPSAEWALLRELVAQQVDFGIGNTRMQGGGARTMEPEFRRAVASARDLVQRHPMSAGARRHLADCVQRLATLASAKFAPDEVLSLLAEAIALREAVLVSSPEQRLRAQTTCEDRVALALAHGDLYRCARRTGGAEQAASAAQEVLAILAETAEADPQSLEAHLAWARWQLLFAEHATLDGDPARGAELAESGLASYRRLSERYPAHSELRRLSVNETRILIRALDAQQRSEDVLCVLAETEQRLALLLELHPNDRSALLVSLSLRQQHAKKLDAIGRTAEADALVARSEASVAALLRCAPDYALSHWWRANLHGFVARRLLARREAERALEHLDAARLEHAVATKLSREQRVQIQDATELELLRAEAHLQRDEPASAAAVLEALGTRLPKDPLAAVPSLAAWRESPEIARVLGAQR